MIPGLPRGCLRAFATAWLAVACLGAAASQGPAVDPDAVDMQNLNFDSLAILTGGGGHSILFSTESGVVVVVDAKRPTVGPRLVEAVKAWTDDRPVALVINTHAHIDHTGGNGAFAPSVDIIAHENTRANVARMGGVRAPNKTFKDKLALSYGSDKVELYYFGAGHTDGDAVVVLPVQRLAYLGDLFPGKTVPVIDAGNGGSALALPQTLAKAVAAITGVTRVIPSHATPPEGRRLHSQGRGWMSWADLQEYAAFARDFVAAATAAQRAGKTVDEGVAAVKSALAGIYSGYDMDGTNAMVQAVYQELQR